jgi:hypothetical protein
MPFFYSSSPARNKVNHSAWSKVAIVTKLNSNNNNTNNNLRITQTIPEQQARKAQNQGNTNKSILWKVLM